MSRPAKLGRAAYSVLIVEDVEEMRLLIEQAVSAMPGFKVSGAARNVWEARLELGRRKPSLLLLDEILPGESSADLLTEAIEQGVTVLLMTGVENPQHAIPEGAAGRVTKPGWERLDEESEALRQAMLRALGVPFTG